MEDKPPRPPACGGGQARALAQDLHEAQLLTFRREAARRMCTYLALVTLDRPISREDPRALREPDKLTPPPPTPYVYSCSSPSARSTVVEVLDLACSPNVDPARVDIPIGVRPEEFNGNCTYVYHLLH